MGGKDHSVQLRSLLEAAGITQREGAMVLSNLTDDEVPERTVRGWLADKKAGTKARCPGWPVFVLQTPEAKRAIAKLIKERSSK